MAQLYDRFEALFLQGNSFRADYESESGHKLTVFDRNFFHLVQLKKNGATTLLNIQEEKPIIRTQVNGFGVYQVDDYRSRHLPAGLDTLLRPHAVFTVAEPQTAHLAFLKHYGDKPYPVIIALVGESKSDGCLIPVTCFPCKLNRARNLFRRWSGGLVWRRGDAGEPCG